MPDVTVLPLVFRAITAPLVPTGADRTGVSVGVLILTDAGKPTFENAVLLIGKGRICRFDPTVVPTVATRRLLPVVEPIVCV